MSHQETPHPEAHLDEWHQHGPAERVPQAENAAHINIPAMFVVFVVMVVSITVMVVGLTIFYKKSMAQMAAVRLETTTQWQQDFVADYRDPAIESIGSYGTVDAEAGIVHVPVESAMDAVIDRYGNNQ